MNISVPLPDKDYKILVRCITYNQSKYICDALNGFAIQETDFPFICIVVDDASKDGNQEVIKQYANDNCDMSKAEISEDDISTYIRVSHKTNSNCVFLFCLLKINLYCKPEKQEIYRPYREVCEYEAVCEGDDYWILPNKIKKQVDLLEHNPDIYLCGTNGLVLYEGLFKNPRYFNKITESRILLPEEIIGHWVFPTASLLFKSDLRKNIPEWTKKIYSGDQIMILISMSRGGIYAFDDIATIYRRTKSEFSVSNSSKKKGREFVTEQHMLMYSEFDLYTKGKYKTLIKKHIATLTKKKRVYKAMNKSVILAFVTDPITFIKIYMNRKNNF